jgi:FtsP/CotA-like multicopper oxidase with cupredoxin domain
MPPYDYDDDRIIFLQDVFPDTAEFIEAALLAIPMEYDTAQEMVLINGKGGGLTEPGTLCNDPLTIIDVEPGKTYRMRLIGGTGVSLNVLAIEDHDNLEVIEADGYVPFHILHLLSN